MTKRKKKRDPSAYLPLSPSMFHVLLSLADGEKHGYAILKDVSRRTRGKVQFSSSTLYDVIQRLESEGLIAESSLRPKPALDDDRRRYYCLTDFGRKVGMSEAARLEAVVSVARAKKFIQRPQPA